MSKQSLPLQGLPGRVNECQTVQDRSRSRLNLNRTQRKAHVLKAVGAHLISIKETAMQVPSDLRGPVPLAHTQHAYTCLALTNYSFDANSEQTV